MGPGEAGERDRSLWGHDILSPCKTVRLADAARAGGRDAPVPAGPTAWGQRIDGPAGPTARGQHNIRPAPRPGPTPRRVEGEDARWRMYLYPVTRAE